MISHINESSYLIKNCNNENPCCFDNIEDSSSISKLKYQSIHDDCIESTESSSVSEASVLKTIAGLSGNILELYDFACFGYFSDIIADQFFPPNQAGNSALIESFAVFGGAFFMRPVGGIVMGYIGDNFGSQRALEISIFLMAFPTFAMGCLPTYAQAGIFSPILLLIVRLLQGFSVGGQLMSSLVFTVEHHPRKYWGFYGSLVMATANIGTLLGGLVGYFVRQSFTQSQLEAFGWRIPFVSGIFVSVCGCYLKTHKDELCRSMPIGQNPIREAFRPQNRYALISSTFVPMLWSCGFYMIFVWLAIFMKDIANPPISNAFGLTDVSLLITNIILFPVAGVLADRFGTTSIMKIGGSLMIVIGPLLVIVIEESRRILYIFIAQCILGILLSLWGAPMMVWLVENFPENIRLTSVSIGYNIAQATMGGMSPGIATYMLDKVGFKSPGFLLSIAGVISLIGLSLQPSNKHI